MARTKQLRLYVSKVEEKELESLRRHYEENSVADVIRRALRNMTGCKPGSDGKVLFASRDDYSE